MMDFIRHYVTDDPNVLIACAVATAAVLAIVFFLATAIGDINRFKSE